MMKLLKLGLVLIATSLPTALVLAQDASPMPTPTPPPTWVQDPEKAAIQKEERDEVIKRLEDMIKAGGTVTYEDLRLPADGATLAEPDFLRNLTASIDDTETTGVVFAEVPDDAQYARLTLDELIFITLDHNFDLENSERDVQISRSELRGSEAFFLPFVDVVGSSRVLIERRERVPSTLPSRVEEPTVVDGVVVPPDPNAKVETTKNTTTTWRHEAGTDVTQNLPTGGSLTGSFRDTRSDVKTEGENGTNEQEDGTWHGEANVRFLQPLLRGSGLLTGDGTDIGTAELRRSRLSEMNTILGDQIQQRDTMLQVISQYFTILQLKNQLLVSKDAIRERYRFLDETRIKYEVGRVAESEILRAEIQFLQEVQSAIDRKQNLDDARESLLILLGLPLDTEISLVDVTSFLLTQGRVEIPEPKQAVTMALSNRYELMRQDIFMAQAEIGVQVARNDVLPELDFDAGTRWFDDGDHSSDANMLDQKDWDAGIGLRIPLQNIQQREAHRRSILRYDQTKTSRLSLERDVTVDALSSHRQVIATEAQLTVLRKQVQQARRNLELINGSFEVGFSTITEVRLAQDDLFNAEISLTNALLNYQINLAQLYVAVGLPLY